MGTVSKRLLGREEQYLVTMKLLLLSLLGCVAVQAAHHEEMKQIMNEIHTYNLRSQCWGEENVLAYDLAKAQMLKWLETIYGSDPSEDPSEYGLPKDKYDAAAVSIMVLNNAATPEEEFVGEFFWGMGH